MKLRKLVKTCSLLLCITLAGAGLTGCGTAKKTEEAAAPAAETKLSGKLVVYSAGPQGLAEKIQKGFESKTGVKVEMFQGTTGKILSRMEAEKANPVVDVVVLASLPAAQGLKKGGQTLEYKDAKNAEKLINGWSDKDGHFFSYSASALGIVYNTKLVKNPPQDWSDLTKEEWRGKVNIPDPAQSGSALDFITGYLSGKGEAGWQLLAQYKQNGVVVAGANQEALDPVITGAKSIVAAGVDYMTYQAKAKGEPVDMLYPSSGTVISPRPAAIIKTSKNTANAKAFIDYLLSDEVQNMVADTYLLPGRSDIKAKGRASADQIPLLKIDWAWMDANGDAVVKKFSEMFK